MWVYGGQGLRDGVGCTIGEKTRPGSHIPVPFASQLTRTPFYFTPASPVSEGPPNRSITNGLAL